MEQPKTLNAFMLIVLVFIFLAGIIEGGTQAILGFLQLQITPARLVSDFIAYCGGRVDTPQCQYGWLSGLWFSGN